MDTRWMTLDIAVGLVAGLVATRATDIAQRVLYRLTPESEKAREPGRGQPTSLVAARKVAETVGLPSNRERLSMLKNAIHYGLGAGWGSLYALLRCNRQVTPLGAGAITGATLSLVVDEVLCPTLGLSAPSRRYPISSHLRGFATHLVYGLALAASAEALHRLLAVCRAGTSHSRDEQHWPQVATMHSRRFGGPVQRWMMSPSR